MHAVDHGSDVWRLLHCAGKPFLALAVLDCCAAGELALGDEIGQYLSGCQTSLASCTIERLLRHDAGLDAPHGIATALMSGRRLSELIEESEADGVRAYSDTMAWFVLAAVLEAATGTAAEAVVRRRVLDDGALPAATRAELDPLHIPAALRGGELAVPIEVDGGHSTALLGELFGDPSGPPDVATGYVAPLRTLATVLHRVACDDARWMSVATASERSFDRRLQRVVSYGRGVLTNLGDHFDADLDGHWIGAGAAGGSTVVATRRSPEPLTLAAAWNRRHITSSSSAARRRATIGAWLVAMGSA